jgi:acyl-CoA thioesterase
VSAKILELIATDRPTRWVLPLQDHLCTGPLDAPFLFGGSGLAACVAAIQAVDSRPLIWATAQYVAYARPGEVLELDVAETARGRQTVQAQVTARVGERVVIMAQGALGERPGEATRQLVARSPAPAPEDCPTVVQRNPHGVHAQFEFRLVRGRFPSHDVVFDRPGDGRLCVWVRPRRKLTLDAPLLAIVADYVSEALSDATGRHVHASSIDNTLRLGPIEPSEWLLCEIAIEALHSGVAHGQMRIYSQTGLLMALASTSLIIRTPRARADAAAGQRLALDLAE